MLREVKEDRSVLKPKDYLLSLASAILLNLSFPGFNFWICGWFAFVPFFAALKNKTGKKAFCTGFLTGLLFWLGNIYWLIHVTMAGWIVLSMYLALYFAVFALIIGFSEAKQNRCRYLFIPCAWVALEYCRSYLLTGFPWSLLGYSQSSVLPVIQIADITGVWGVSFLVMMGNVFVYRLSPGAWRLKAKGQNPPSGIKQGWIFIICIAVSLGYGFYKLSTFDSQRQTPNAKRDTLKICAVQGNISQDLKWSASSQEYIFEKYSALTRKAALSAPELIIWPEAALPVVLEEKPQYYRNLKDLVRELGRPLLFGAVTMRQDLYYNSALLLAGSGELIGRYDKLHLVPFGEYIPLRKILGFMETVAPIGDIERGKEYTVFSLKPKNASSEQKFSVLICFEDLFPELSRNFVKRGAELLINITNDAWYKHTSAAYQHFQASVLRAVENRTFLVRAANTGVSGFISPEGKIISLVADERGENLFVDGFSIQDIQAGQKGLSFYTRFGDIFLLGLLFIAFYVTISFLKK